MSIDSISSYYINKTKVSILEIYAGDVSDAEAIKIASELETSLRSQQLKVVVIHGSGLAITELSDDDIFHQIVEIPSLLRTTEEQEVYLRRIRDDLTKFGVKQFTIISAD